MSRQQVRFLLGGMLQEVGDLDPTTTVLNWLRLARRLNGTKEGCAEGDCGACTIVVGRIQDGRMRYGAVNACIQFLPMIDGCHVLTVEHLRRPDGRLHPVQQAMVDCHASQCGFCTPGFVMSLFALYLNEDRPGEDRIRDALAGNLCRCTGYAPIIAAAKRMFDLGDRSADVLPITAETLMERLGFSSMGETLQFGARQGACVAPTTTAELAQTLLAHPEATIVAGATDVGLWVTKSLKELKSTVHVGAIAEMRRISETADALTIGGAATFADAQPALARLYPDFGELIRRIGGEQVRTVGTIGGNIANGSPIGDSPPALIAIGASIILRRGDERRRIAIEDFFIAYGRQDRRPSEFVEAISLPKPTPNAHFRAYKISKRFDQDISALCGAFLVELSGGVATRVRIAFGGMAGTPKRAAAAEAALLGRPWTLETVEAAMAALRTDYAPLSDWRASSAYRLTVAANLLLKFFSETTGAAGTRLVGQGRLVHA